jgi:hypothetical protein
MAALNCQAHTRKMIKLNKKKGKEMNVAFRQMDA